MKLEYSLVQPDDPILTTPTKPFKKVGLETILAYNVMRDLLKKHTFKWFALAAPQVGCSQRFFVTDFLEIPVQYKMYFNPVATPFEEAKVETEFESCVSLPGVRVPVPRFNAILLQYEDVERNKHTLFLGGKQARVAQHEVDHLNGILITKSQSNALPELPSEKGA